MIRTQVSLSRWEYQQAKLAARQQGISLAEFLRRALRLIMPVAGGKQRPWMKYAGDIASGDPESSQKIDEWIYGQKD